MWSIAIALSWQAEQAATIGELTSVVPCALHGLASEQTAATAVQGCVLLQVQGVVPLQALVTVPIFCVKLVGTLLTVYGPEMVTLHGLVVLHVQGAVGAQLLVVVPIVCVPLIPSGSVALTLAVA